MPKPLRPELAAALPELTVPTTPTADTLRVLGGIGLPGDEVVGRLPGSSHETRDVVDWEVANTTHERAVALFDAMLPGLVVPSVTELHDAGVDFAKLERGYEGYKAAGMEPEFIIAPMDLPLQGWKDIYSNLCQWQDTNHSDSAFRLKNPGDGDGLWVANVVKDSWSSLSQQAVEKTPGIGLNTGDGLIAWKALVVPTASKSKGGLVTHTSHDLTTRYNKLDAQIALVRSAHLLTPSEGVIIPQNAHMPIGAQLTLQALRIHNKQPLMHEKIGGFCAFTWNAGTFTVDGEATLRAPAAGWYSANGQVRVDSGGAADRSVGGIGVRLPVWG